MTTNKTTNNPKARSTARKVWASLWAIDSVIRKANPKASLPAGVLTISRAKGLRLSVPKKAETLTKFYMREGYQTKV